MYKERQGRGKAERGVSGCYGNNRTAFCAMRIASGIYLIWFSSSSSSPSSSSTFPTSPRPASPETGDLFFLFFLLFFFFFFFDFRFPLSFFLFLSGFLHSLIVDQIAKSYREFDDRWGHFNEIIARFHYLRRPSSASFENWMIGYLQRRIMSSFLCYLSE